MPTDPQTLDDFIEWFVSAVVGSRMAAWANTNDGHAEDDRLYAAALEFALDLVYHEKGLPPLPEPARTGTLGLAEIRLWATRARQLRDDAARTPRLEAIPTDASGTGPVRKPHGWTASELWTEAEISEDTFRRIRRVAGIPLSKPGGGGAQTRFLRLDLVALIDAVSTSTTPQFRARRAIAESWLSLLNPQ